MKVVVSYINSMFDKRKTIKLIDESIADGIHVDLMDGKYVANKNFEITELPSLFASITKPLDIHLMTNNPSKNFTELFKLKPACIYIHPSTEENPIKALEDITSMNIDAGIVINPDEDTLGFEKYFPYVKRVLLMSVYPGKGGQEFLDSTLSRLKELNSYQEKYNFEIYIDGGINADTVKLVRAADGVVSGSYVCNNQDFNKQISELKL